MFKKKYIKNQERKSTEAKFIQRKNVIKNAIIFEIFNIQ